MKEARLAIFASGSGTNAERIMEYFAHHPTIQVKMVLSNNPNAYALERAKKFSVPTRIFSKKEWRESGDVLSWLQENQITHVVLAGFLWLVPPFFIQAFPNKIVNIHPALLPKYGGKGMYGMKVHEVVKKEGEKITGISIHLVNEAYDEGTVLFQATCPVHPHDTAKRIADKVHQLEYLHFPKVIDHWVMGLLPKKPKGLDSNL